MTILRLILVLWMSAAASAAYADGMAMPMAGPKGSADAAFMKSMSSMQHAMDAPMTGDPDKDFVTMMLPLHQGAVDMANIELQYGKDPGLRAMAKDIVASQAREIATMKAWQARHGR